MINFKKETKKEYKARVHARWVQQAKNKKLVKKLTTIQLKIEQLENIILTLHSQSVIISDIRQLRIKYQQEKIKLLTINNQQHDIHKN